MRSRRVVFEWLLGLWSWVTGRPERRSTFTPRERFAVVGVSVAACLGLALTPPAHADVPSPTLLARVATTAVPHDLMVGTTGRALYAISNAYFTTGPTPVMCMPTDSKRRPRLVPQFPHRH